jgi:hypothetical protein
VPLSHVYRITLDLVERPAGETRTVHVTDPRPSSLGRVARLFWTALRATATGGAESDASTSGPKPRTKPKASTPEGLARLIPAPARLRALAKQLSVRSGAAQRYDARQLDALLGAGGTCPSFESYVAALVARYASGSQGKLGRQQEHGEQAG